MENNSLIPPHGGYRKLKSFQMAQMVFDLTVRFCDQYIDKRSRTHDQMIQAARSGVQNIAEGSQASGTSKRTELKLTGVARASLEELCLDYEDFLRQRGLTLWAKDDHRRMHLVARRCNSVDEIARWAKETFDKQNGLNGPDGLNGQDGHDRHEPSIKSISSIKSTLPEIAANAAHILIGVTCALLSRQIDAQAKAFEKEGGFTERLYRIRSEKRKNQSQS